MNESNYPPDYASDLEKLDRLAKQNKTIYLCVLSVMVLAIVGLSIGVIVGNCKQDGCRISENPTLTLPPTGTVTEEVVSSPSPGETHAPLPTATTAPITGVLSVSQGILCEAGTESWHTVTIENTGTEENNYRLGILPGNMALYSDRSPLLCPPFEETLSPLSGYNPIKLAGSQVNTYSLQVQLSAKPDDAFKWELTTDADPPTMLAEVEIELPIGDASGELKLAGTDAEPYFVQGYNESIAFNFTPDRPGRYKLICKDVADQEVYASAPILIADDINATEIFCPLLATDEFQPGEWVAEIHRLKRDAQPFSQTDTAIATLPFIVAEPTYNLDINRDDYLGITWGPLTTDPGLIVIYSIKNTGNIPFDLTLLLSSTNPNVKIDQPYYVTILQSQDTLSGKVVSIENTSVTLEGAAGAHHNFIIIPIKDQPGLLGNLMPCKEPQSNCSVMRLAVWLQTKVLRHLSEINSVSYTLQFATQNSVETTVGIKTWDDEITEPPVDYIVNPNATRPTPTPSTSPELPASQDGN